MMRVFFAVASKLRIINTDEFDELWKEILGFKNINKSKAEKSPDIIGIQDESGRMLLLALYDEDRWVLETLEGDWGTQFGKIDLAGDFNVQETLLNDEELEMMLKTLLTEGRLCLPSSSKS